MARESLPLFLERRSYRKRRKVDALKMLAFLGAILWLVPIVWPNEAGGDTDPLAMSRALYYIFGVWAALIVLAFALTRNLNETDDAAREPDDAP